MLLSFKRTGQSLTEIGIPGPISYTSDSLFIYTVVTLQILVMFSQSDCNILEIPDVLSKLFKIRMLGFILHCPMFDKWIKPMHGKINTKLKT